MRLELFYNPLLLFERLGQKATERRRLRRLRGTPASHLQPGHIDSLELLELLREPAPQVIYDIGANIGTWTLLAKAIHPQAEVHAFEPLVQHIAGFKRETQTVRNVHLHPVALGSKKEELAMQVTSFSDASSLLPIGTRLAEKFNVNKCGEEMVVVERLDDYILKNRLPPPNLIKLDVQGYELEVLRGAMECLRQVDYIISEVSFEEHYAKQCLFEEVVSFLAENGFRLRAFASGTALGVPICQTDVLFVRVK